MSTLMISLVVVVLATVAVLWIALGDDQSAMERRGRWREDGPEGKPPPPHGPTPALVSPEPGALAPPVVVVPHAPAATARGETIRGPVIEAEPVGLAHRVRSGLALLLLTGLVGVVVAVAFAVVAVLVAGTLYDAAN